MGSRESEPQPPEPLTPEQKEVLATNTAFCILSGLAEVYNADTLALADRSMLSDIAEVELFEPDNVAFQRAMRSLPGSELPFAFGMLEEHSFHVFKVNPVTRGVPIEHSVEIGVITHEGRLLARSVIDFSIEIVTAAYELYQRQVAVGLVFDIEGWGN